VSKLNVEVYDSGNVSVSGEITFFTINDALSFKVLTGGPDVVINLSGVTRSDSSGLALMVHWLREAKEKQINLKFEAIPEKLFALAKVSNLDEILPIV